MLNKKKWVTLVLLFLILTIFLTGCSLFKKNKLQDLDKSEKNWQGIITLWDYPRWPDSTGNRFHWIEGKIKEFEKNNPGVFIELRKLNWEVGPFELDTAVSTKTYPDIAPVGANCSYARQGVLEPIELFLTEDEIKDYYKGALDAVTFNERIWGFPWFMTTYALYLNMDIFEEREVKPPEDGIWTWEEFITKLQDLTYDNNRDGKNDMFGFHSFIKEGYYNTWGIITSDGAKPFSEDLSEYTFASDESISGLQKLVDLVQKYKVTPPEFGEQGPKEAWTAFLEDKNIAVFPAGSWAVNVLRQREKEGKGFKFDVAGFPLGKLGMPSIIHPEIGAYGIFKQNDEAKKQVCISFLKFITSPEEQKKLKEYGVFPARKSVGNIYTNDRYMMRIQENLNYTSPPPDHPNWVKIEPIIQNQIREAVTGKKTPKQALEDAKAGVVNFLNTN